MHRFLVTCLVAFAVGAVSADTRVYKSTDEEGVVEFSDRPADGAEPVKVRPAQSIDVPTPKLSTPSQGAPESAVPSSPYTQFAIRSPQDDEALVEHSGRVTVGVAINPPLRLGSGHRLQFRLDGKAMGPLSAATSIVLENVDRGTHVIAADVVDSAGRVVASTQPSTFHLQRTSVIKRGGGN
jgi:hypothetical protein